VHDAGNSVLYIQLYFDVVASAASCGQRNNAALVVAAPTVVGAAVEPGRGLLVATGRQVLSRQAVLTGRGLIAAQGGVAVVLAPGTVALADALAASVTLSDALAATVTLSDTLAATVTLSDAIAEA
jgi:hypothetical protein